MPLYRKKPVVIEARQITAENLDEVAEWSGGRALHKGGAYDDDMLVIETLEGSMWGGVGAWIIRGVKGEFYPCQDDIFAETYEEAV
jgi:hypothetical protein